MKSIPVAKECEEQAALFQWAHYWNSLNPELALMYHVPNGGRRDKIEAANLKREGVKAGVPDICLPVARGKYHGLYIELKRIKGGRVSEAQSAWIERLTCQGYRVAVCYGWEEAAKEIQDYMMLPSYGEEDEK